MKIIFKKVYVIYDIDWDGKLQEYQVYDGNELKKAIDRLKELDKDLDYYKYNCVAITSDGDHTPFHYFIREEERNEIEWESEVEKFQYAQAVIDSMNPNPFNIDCTFKDLNTSDWRKPITQVMEEEKNKLIYKTKKDKINEPFQE